MQHFLESRVFNLVQFYKLHVSNAVGEVKVHISNKFFQVWGCTCRGISIPELLQIYSSLQKNHLKCVIIKYTVQANVAVWTEIRNKIHMYMSILATHVHSSWDIPFFTSVSHGEHFHLFEPSTICHWQKKLWNVQKITCSKCIMQEMCDKKEQFELLNNYAQHLE